VAEVARAGGVGAAVAEVPLRADLHRQAIAVVDRGNAVAPVAQVANALALLEAEAAAAEIGAIEEADFAERGLRAGARRRAGALRLRLADTKIDRRTARHLDAEVDARLRWVHRIATGAEIIGRNPAIGAGL